MSGDTPSSRSGRRNRSGCGKTSTPPASSKIALTPVFTPALYVAGLCARPGPCSWRRAAGPSGSPAARRVCEALLGLAGPCYALLGRDLALDQPGEVGHPGLRLSGHDRRDLRPQFGEVQIALEPGAVSHRGQLVADPQAAHGEFGLQGQAVRPVMLHHGPGPGALDTGDRHVLGDVISEPRRMIDITLDAAGGRVPLGPVPGRGHDVEDRVDGAVGDKVVADSRH